EIGLAKYKDMSITDEPVNPFKVEKNTEKLFVIREREKEIKRIEILKKRMFNESSEILSKNQLVSLSTLTGGSKGYLENKKDRSGAIRVVNDIGSRNANNGRSVSEVRG